MTPSADIWRCALRCLLTLLTACAPATRPPIFTPRATVPLAGSGENRAGWPAADWWKRFDDPQLDQLMRLALQDSPDLQVAQARYNTALRAAELQRAGLSPQAKGYVDASHG